VKRAKCIIYIYDLYPEIAVVAGILKRNSWLTKRMSGVTSFFYKRADAIFVLGRDMQKLVREKLNHSTLPVHYVPILVDTQNIIPLPRETNPFLNQLNLREKFVVQIAGNLGFLHDVDLFLEAAKILEDTPDICFLLFSSGKKIPQIEKTIAEERRKNIILHPRLPREKTNEIVNACDLAISSLFIPGMYGLASPSRMYGILAAGKPQLAVTEDGTEVALAIREDGLGWRVSPRDVTGAVNAIREAYAKRYHLQEMQQAARKAAVEKYDSKIITGLIYSVVKNYIDGVKKT
jgi:glycosyltransferase involved in cell wall biosynthesis